MITYEEGLYTVEILNQELSESSNGNPQLVLTIKPKGILINTVLNPCPLTTSGLEPRVFLTITDNTISWVLDTLRHLGFAGKSFNDLDPDVKGHHSFTGVQTEALCKHDEWEGRQREKWSIYRAGSKATKPLEKKLLRGLDAKFARHLNTTAIQQSGTKSENNPQATAPHTNKDDIPF